MNKRQEECGVGEGGEGESWQEAVEGGERGGRERGKRKRTRAKKRVRMVGGRSKGGTTELHAKDRG